MTMQLYPVTEAFQQAETTTGTDEVDIVCGNQGAVCEVLYEWTDNELFAEATSIIVGIPVKIVLIGVIALLLNALARRAIGRLTDRLGTVTAQHAEGVVAERSVDRAEERASTIGSLLRSLSTAFIFGAALLMMLEVLGVSLIPVIASAGVLGLAIGFGAQSVVEDLLRGLFMLAEDQFGVGDRIDVGSVNGYVVRVTLRTTVIRDSTGTLWHVPNSEIDWVANEAQKSSRATIDIGVSYTADLDEATDVLLRAARDTAEDPDWSEVVQRPPEVSGVEELGDDAVDIRVIVWVEAGERRRFERELRRRLKEALDAAGIEMPNRQIDVRMRDQEAVA
jgi:small conductance mechanosensitive channel